MQNNLKYTITAIDKTKRVFAKITAGLKKVTGAVFSLKAGFVLLAGVAGIGLLIKKSLDSIDNLGKLSRVLGLTTKELAAFELAAELGGMTLEGFAKASKMVSKSVFDFLVRGTGEAVDAFKALGISQRDLLPIQNDQTAILALIGDRFADMENGAIKSALAVKLFGSRAAAMLNVFDKGGGKSIRDATRDVELFGNALDDSAVRGVEEANDAITRLSFLFKGVRDNLVAGLAPALTWLVDMFRNRLVEAFNANGRGVKGWAHDFIVTMLQMTIDALGAFDSLITGIIKRWQSLKVSLGVEDAGPAGAIKKQIELLDTRMNSLFAMQTRLKNVGEGFQFTGEMGLNPVKRAAEIKRLGVAYDETLVKINGLWAALRVLREADDKNPLTDMIGDIKKLLEDTIKAVPDGGIVAAVMGGGEAEKTIEDLVNFGKAFDDAFSNIEAKILITTKTIEEAWDTTFISLRDDLAKFFETGKLSFSGFIGTIKAQLAKLAANKLLGMLFNMGDGGGIGGFLGSIFGVEKNAQGGQISAGQPTLVGEMGPELIVPRNNGKVIPNDALSSGGGKQTIINQTLNISTDVRNTIRAEIANYAEIGTQMALAAMQNQQRGIR